MFDLTISSVNDDEAMILRLPRLLRLLRVSHAFRYLYRWGELLPVSMYQLRMLKLGFGILLFVHVSASLHLVAGILNREDPLGWMSRTGALWDSNAHKVGFVQGPQCTFPACSVCARRCPRPPSSS